MTARSKRPARTASARSTRPARPVAPAAPATPAVPVKRGRGRPPLVPGQPGHRYQVHLLPSLAERLRDFGDGSLSAGIRKAAELLKLV